MKQLKTVSQTTPKNPNIVVIKSMQYYQQKMTPEELQAHLTMRRSGASKTKNGKAYDRHPKHRKRDY